MYEQFMPDDVFEGLVSGGPLIGRGSSREVYAVPSDDQVVVKKMHLQFPAANIMEWTVWQAVEDSKYRDLFGRCISVSLSGRFLLMEKLIDVDWSTNSIPQDLPHWVTDRFHPQFGRSSCGKIKLRDYGMIKLKSVLVPYEASFLLGQDQRSS